MYVSHFPYLSSHIGVHDHDIHKSSHFDQKDLLDKLRKLEAPLEAPETYVDKLRACSVIQDSMAPLITFWNALKTANQVLGADMPMADDAQKLEREVRTALVTAQKTLQDLAKDSKKQYVTSQLKEDFELCEQL